MQNPFESGHIKNYLLFYASVVVIMILFFIATTLFHESKEIDKKIFNSNQSSIEDAGKKEVIEQNVTKSRFKLLNKGY